MFDLFNTIRSTNRYRMIAFGSQYAIVSPFGSIRHIGKRKHIVYVWNKKYAIKLEDTVGSYWINNPNLFLRVAYGYN